MDQQITQPSAARSSYVLPAVLSVIYLAFSIILPIHRYNFDQLTPLARLALILVPTAVFMLLQLLLIQSFVHLRLKPLNLFIGGVAGLVLWFAVMFYFHPARQFPPNLIFVMSLTKFTMLGLLLTVALTFFGSLLSGIIKEKNLLLPVALVAMPIDFLGAMTSQGFTHDMVKHAPKFVASVSVSVPAVTSRSAQGLSIGPIAYIGPGDILFMALFFTAVLKFDLDERKTFWWMYALLTLSMMLVLRLPDFEVGALVPMGIAVIIANWKLIQLKRDEIFAVAYAGILVLALIGFFFWSSHRYLFHSH